MNLSTSLRISSALVLLSLSLFSASAASATKPRNIILFIGDGMGPAQVQASLFQSKGMGLDKDGDPPKFCFENFPAIGYLSTFSANSFVTDSAAAGTALSSGHKTDNGMVGVTPDETSVQNIAELAHAKGKAVGILSSVAFNHATPACFFAHASSRASYDEITSQALESTAPDVLMGGGVYSKKWNDKLIKDSFNKAGFKVFTVDNYGDLTPENVGKSRVLGYFDVANPKTNQQLDFESSRTAECREPHLSDMTVKALQLVSRNPEGFFMMVEGGSIDWAGHSNNAPAMVGEVVELDKTIATTLEWLKKAGKLEDTLIIVTADHETGGLTMPGPYKKRLDETSGPLMSWTSHDHTGIPVMVWATGPSAEQFRGKHDNTHVFNVMKAGL